MEKAYLQALKDYSNELCGKYGLTTTETNTRAGKMQKWKKDLIHTAFLALNYTDSIEGFIDYMEQHGYSVKWEADRKYITFTTPDGIKVRDNKLFDERLLKDNLELYYAMGGCDSVHIVELSFGFFDGHSWQWLLDFHKSTSFKILALRLGLIKMLKNPENSNTQKTKLPRLL